MIKKAIFTIIFLTSNIVNAAWLGDMSTNFSRDHAREVDSLFLKIYKGGCEADFELPYGRHKTMNSRWSMHMGGDTCIVSAVLNHSQNLKTEISCVLPSGKVSLVIDYYEHKLSGRDYLIRSGNKMMSIQEYLVGNGYCNAIEY